MAVNKKISEETARVNLDGTEYVRIAAQGENYKLLVSDVVAAVALLLPLKAERRVIAAGAVTIDAVTDDIIRVAKTVEAATVVNLPTIAARKAANKGAYFIKNEMSNGALYTLTIVPAGTDLTEGTATLVMDGQRQGLWLSWDDSVTPNNWEIRTPFSGE